MREPIDGITALVALLYCTCIVSACLQVNSAFYLESVNYYHAATARKSKVGKWLSPLELE